MMIEKFAIVKCCYIIAPSGYDEKGHPRPLNTGKEGCLSF
jgi:hypothetical protein